MPIPIPTPTPQTGLRALRAMLAARHPLAAMQVFHHEIGDVFRIQLPGFTPVVLVGPDAARFVLVQGRHDLRWRNERDPVTDLLRHGVLVEDGEPHDHLRRLMNPALHRRMIEGYTRLMLDAADEITNTWAANSAPDMLVEMRKIALLILTRSLFRCDFSPELRNLWSAVLGVIAYISPGLWMLWPGAPRPQYRRAVQRMDEYLYRIIRLRRQTASLSADQDLLSALIADGLGDDLIRDQLLTMLIAGHDTSTALLAWSLYLLGAYPDAQHRAQHEVDQTIPPGCHEKAVEANAGLNYLGAVIDEALRLYPPIHLGSRVAAVDLDYAGYRLPAGERVIYSIYLTQRHPAYWEQPDDFIPERHLEKRPAPYTWLAFGGGPRNCIGSAFGQWETKLVLSRLLQRFELRLVENHVHPHMGATLEPRPGVRMAVTYRK